MQVKIKQPIFLCGMMGSGKSTIGRILARKLSCPFTDLDSRIEEEQGMPVREIFRKNGEPAFREIEKNLILQMAATENGVIALGGGTLQDQGIVDHLKKYGCLIFLDAPLSVLLQRLKRDSKRPLLLQSGEIGLQKRIEQLLNERRRFYSQSHLIINTQRQSPGRVADIIVQNINNHES